MAFLPQALRPALAGLVGAANSILEIQEDTGLARPRKAAQTVCHWVRPQAKAAQNLPLALGFAAVALHGARSASVGAKPVFRVSLLRLG